jgi:hypothetical protein
MKYSKKANMHTPESRRLKYCKGCRSVWELGLDGTQLKYKHLPTYGLYRLQCESCDNESLHGNVNSCKISNLKHGENNETN